MPVCVSNNHRLWSGTIRGEIDRYRDNERMRATERVTGEVIDRPGKSERLRMIEIEENGLKKIGEMIRRLEAATVRRNNENARAAEEKLAEDRLRAREHERRECERLEGEIKKLEELEKVREEVLRVEEELQTPEECAPLGASRGSGTGLYEEDISNLEGVENLVEELRSGTMFSKYNAPHSLCWTVASMVIILGMVYIATPGMQGSVGTTPIKGLSSCWANTTSHVTASRPISWKLPEAVGTLHLVLRKAPATKAPKGAFVVI